MAKQVLPDKYRKMSDHELTEKIRRIKDRLGPELVILVHHYQRREIARTENDLLDYLHETWALGRQIREAELAGRHPKNPDACHRYGVCAFWEACAHGMRLEDHPSKFVQLEDVHPELGEARECEPVAS